MMKLVLSDELSGTIVECDILFLRLVKFDSVVAEIYQSWLIRVYGEYVEVRIDPQGFYGIGVGTYRAHLYTIEPISGVPRIRLHPIIATFTNTTEKIDARIYDTCGRN